MKYIKIFTAGNLGDLEHRVNWYLREPGAPTLVDCKVAAEECLHSRLMWYVATLVVNGPKKGAP